MHTAAEAAGVVLVLFGNLYAYGPTAASPLTEELPLAATGTKGRVRAEVWQRTKALRDEGRIKATEVRASDFFGPASPTATTSPPWSKSRARKARWAKCGVPTQPPLSVREMVDRLATGAGIAPVSVRGLPVPLLSVAGLVSPLLRELKEVRYQFGRPFVVDAGKYETAFAVRATPLQEQLKATVDWWRARSVT